MLIGCMACGAAEHALQAHVEVVAMAAAAVCHIQISEKRLLGGIHPSRFPELRQRRLTKEGSLDLLETAIACEWAPHCNDRAQSVRPRL